MPTIRNQRSALRAQLLAEALGQLLAAPGDLAARAELRDALLAHALTTKRPRALAAAWLRHHLASRHPTLYRGLYLELVAALPSGPARGQTPEHSGTPGTGRASMWLPETPTAPDP
ncbi:MAG: hypothetical protein ACK53A_07045 [Gemmatimonadota bacterium]|jgi:hypothetical protein|nr:hypothetical protein [Gemmatimonadota bacterium]